MRYLTLILIIVGIFTFYPICAQDIQILLSSRWFRPKDQKDSLSTLKAIEDFNVDRIEWMYNDSNVQLEQLKKKCIPFSLTLNPQIADSVGYTTFKGRIVDINGKPYVAPWMKDWKIKNPYWGCVNNPDFSNLFLEKSKRIVDLGAYAIMVDDSRLNDHAMDWGGCFCVFCVEGFSKYLFNNELISDKSFNYRNYILRKDIKIDQLGDEQIHNHYRQFQRMSVVIFLQKWRNEISNYSGGKILFGTNNFQGRWNEIYNIFDYGIAEIPEKDASLDIIDNVLTSSKKKQIFAYASNNLYNNYKFFLHAYLKGASCLIPWDHLLSTKLVNDNLTRYFVRKEDFAELTTFISENRVLFYDQLIDEKGDVTISKKDTDVRLFLRYNGKDYFLFAYGDLDQEDILLEFSFKNGKVEQVLESIFPSNLNRKAESEYIVEGKIICLRLLTTS